VLDARQNSLCRVLGCADCPTLGKPALDRAPDSAECGARQSRLCRVPDKKHSAKPPALDKDPDSGSDVPLVLGLTSNTPNFSSSWWFNLIRAKGLSFWSRSWPSTKGLFGSLYPTVQGLWDAKFQQSLLFDYLNTGLGHAGRVQHTDLSHARAYARILRSWGTRLCACIRGTSSSSCVSL
jgi:hypothetical protein